MDAKEIEMDDKQKILDDALELHPFSRCRLRSG